MMVKSTSAVLATTLLASSALAWESTTTTTTKPVDPATTDAPWLDWTSSTTTTKPVDPVKTSSTTVDPWVDWTSSTTTTKKVDPAKTTSTTVDPWVDWTTTTTTTKKVDPAKTTTTPVVDPTWSDWVSSTTLKTVTSAATTTKPAASTTTKAPSAAPTCPSDNKKSVLAGGSCGCSFTVNCGVKASPDQNSSFWEKTSGGIVPTLAECLALCDSNSKCEAALWVDDATNGDYHHCWQISGLGAPTGDGVAQISYKGACSGKCTESYTKQ